VIPLIVDQDLSTSQIATCSELAGKATTLTPSDITGGSRCQSGHPSKGNRRIPIPHDRAKYRWRNLVERLFSKLKNWRGSLTGTTKPRIHTLAL